MHLEQLDVSFYTLKDVVTQIYENIWTIDTFYVYFITFVQLNFGCFCVVFTSSESI